MAGRIIDADGHVRERDEDLLEFLPGRYQDLMHDPTYSFFPAITGGTNALRDPKIHSPHSVDLDGVSRLRERDALISSERGDRCLACGRRLRLPLGLRRNDPGRGLLL